MNDYMMQKINDEIVNLKKEVSYRDKLLREQYITVQQLAYPELDLSDNTLESMWQVYKIEKNL